MNKQTTLILIILMLPIQYIWGQSDLITYQSKAGFASNTLNVASIPEYRLVFSFPMISSLSSETISSIQPSHLLTANGEKTMVNIPHFLNNLNDENYIKSNAHLNLFQFGFQIKSFGFVTFGVQHHLNLFGNFSDEFLTFLGKGNLAYLNETVQFSEEQLELLEYNDFALGYTHSIDNRLRIGARIKLLKGVNHFKLENWNASILTDEYSVPAYSIDADIDFQAKVGGILSKAFPDDSTETAIIADDIYGRGSGLGMDIGAEYQLNKNFSFSLALNNILGKITWENDYAKEISLDGTGQFVFDGFETTLAENGEIDFDKELETLETKIKETFEIHDVKKEYATKIGPEILLGATCSLRGGEHKLSALYRGINRFEKLHHNFGIVYHYSPTYFLQLSTSYSVLPGVQDNFGLGCTFQSGPMQLHIFTNNLMSLLDQHHAKNVSLRAGCNFVFSELRSYQKRDLLEKTEIYKTAFNQESFSKEKKPKVEKPKDQKEEVSKIKIPKKSKTKERASKKVKPKVKKEKTKKQKKKVHEQKPTFENLFGPGRG